MGASSVIQAWLESHQVLEEGGVCFSLWDKCLSSAVFQWLWIPHTMIPEIFPLFLKTAFPKTKYQNYFKLNQFKRPEANALKSKMCGIKCCLIHHQNPDELGSNWGVYHRSSGDSSGNNMSLSSSPHAGISCYSAGNRPLKKQPLNWWLALLWFNIILAVFESPAVSLLYYISHGILFCILRMFA